MILCILLVVETPCAVCSVHHIASNQIIGQSDESAKVSAESFGFFTWLDEKVSNTQLCIFIYKLPGLHLDCIWISSGVHLDSTRITPGFCLDFTWTAPELHLDCTWNPP